MSKAFILMTALPPTVGHLQLVQFADLLADDGIVLLINTQPQEPFAYERVAAMRQVVVRASISNARVEHMHQTMEQDPSAPGFWDMWRGIMTDLGVTSNDYIVASEHYGQKLADITGASFFPYDIGRSLNPCKATPIRENPQQHFGDILPEFRKYIRTTVTVFGAESTGKTTLSKALAEHLDGQWLFEYARPYLENTTNEITSRSMTAIWKGQAALQRQADNLAVTPYAVQDTDLFSAVGYWKFPHWQSDLGDCPKRLITDASRLKSDLYIVTRSNIPFEADPLRYGGDQREGSDEYWIKLLRTYGLPYVVLESQSLDDRITEALSAIKKTAQAKAQTLSYDRHGL